MKSARWDEVATRLDLVEQKVEHLDPSSGGGGSDIDQESLIRLWGETMWGAQAITSPFGEPHEGDTIWTDANTSMFLALFGWYPELEEMEVGGWPHIRRMADNYTSFYEITYTVTDERWGTMTPFADQVFGPANDDWVTTLRAGSNATRRTLIGSVYGDVDSLATTTAAGQPGSLVAAIFDTGTRYEDVIEDYGSLIGYVDDEVEALLDLIEDLEELVGTLLSAVSSLDSRVTALEAAMS